MYSSEQNQLVTLAKAGSKDALEQLLSQVQDSIFNLSLRMLGTVPDAQDASQDILVKVITHLSSFREESSFSTWVWRIAVNYLKDYKKHRFAHAPMNFDFYGQDVQRGFEAWDPSLYKNVDEELLTQELKLSCTNVMLQCLEPEERCIFILGTMFRADSRAAGEILDLTPENYRQKLCRIRKRVGEFLSTFCGLGGGSCDCKKRLSLAIREGRLNPGALEFSTLVPGDREALFCGEMETLDQLSLAFDHLPAYHAPEKQKEFLQELLCSSVLQNIREL